tara:strand:+ start:207 stop:920 length:714 start_codon:yes stop_codon:yes gene_type:complete
MVNIDTVYQRVLSLANKEQRGYITPLEYNLLANQAQLDVFEQYFYDRSQTAKVPGNDTHFSDVDSMLDEKIAVFESSTITNNGLLPTLPAVYRLGSITTKNAAGVDVEAEGISRKDWLTISGSPLLKPTNQRPVYVRTNNTVQIFGTNNVNIAIGAGTATMNYIQQPLKVEWGYDVIGEKALHNGSPNKTTHFQHHPSEETKLVIKILELAGVIIQDPGLIQYGDSEGLKKIQQEKQ